MSPEAQILHQDIVAELDALRASGSWKELIAKVDELRDELGPVPELLSGPSTYGRCLAFRV